jgi:hypothetical protein
MAVQVVAVISRQREQVISALAKAAAKRFAK